MPMSNQLAPATAATFPVVHDAIAPRSWEPNEAASLAIDDVGLASTGSVLHFTQDQQVFGEGDQAEFLFKVASGVIRTCRFHGDGRRQIDDFHIAGDIFGLETSQHYQVSAEAVCDCMVIAYRRRGVEKRAPGNETLSQQLFLVALQSMNRAREHALLLGRRSAVEKVASFLIEWGQRAPASTTVTLAMTRQDIADYLGLTIETVSRTLSQLERDGLITLVTARRIEIKDVQALRALHG